MPVFKFYKQHDSSLDFIEFSVPYHHYLVETLKLNVRFGSTSFSEINNNFRSSISAGHGPLPVAVRYIDQSYCLIERPPFQITLDYSPTRSGNVRRSVKPVKIWIPWTITCINYHHLTTFSDYKIYFNYQPLQSIEDVLLLPYVSNIFTDGRVCLGRSIANLDTQTPDIMTCYYLFFNEVFSGGWNSDIYPSSSSHIREANRDKNNYIFSDIHSSPLVEEENISKVRDNKIKFYKSTHVAFSTANFYYNLSLLTLEQTLEVVKNAINHETNYHKINASVLLKRDSTVPISYSHDNSVYSSHYASVTLQIQDLSYYSSHLHLNKVREDDLYNYQQIVGNHKKLSYFNLNSYLENNIESIFDEIYLQIKEGQVSINVDRCFNFISDDEFKNIFSQEIETI